jgi:hypothetical protein
LLTGFFGLRFAQEFERVPFTQISVHFNLLQIAR